MNMGMFSICKTFWIVRLKLSQKGFGILQCFLVYYFIECLAYFR